MQQQNPAPIIQPGMLRCGHDKGLCRSCMQAAAGDVRLEDRRARRVLFPPVRRQERCGRCLHCRVPGLHQACIARREEMRAALDAAAGEQDMLDVM